MLDAAVLALGQNGGESQVGRGVEAKGGEEVEWEADGPGSGSRGFCGVDGDSWWENAGDRCRLHCRSMLGSAGGGKWGWRGLGISVGGEVSRKVDREGKEAMVAPPSQRLAVLGERGDQRVLRWGERGVDAIQL